MEDETEDLGATKDRLRENARQAAFASEIVERFAQATSSEQRLAEIQRIGQLFGDLPERILIDVIPMGLADPDPRVRGETCYVLGRTKNPQSRGLLSRMLDDGDDWVRRQAQSALKKLSHGLDTRAEVEKLREHVDTLREALQPGLELGLAARLVDESRRNELAYQELEIELIEREQGRFAVFCDGRLVGVADTRSTALEVARNRDPECRPYIREIGAKVPRRSPERR